MSSSFEERLVRDIAAVTGDVVVTESNLRDAREAVDERIDSQRQRNRRRALVAAAAAAAVIPMVGVVAFQALDSDDKTGQPVSPNPTSPSADDAAPEADYAVVGATYLEGPGRWALTATGDPDAPMAVFDVPAGFSAREVYIWADFDGLGQLTYWAPTRVLADPCDVDAASLPLGPTVEDLAAALAAQQRTTATEPVPVELDGHRGLYLELKPPADFDFAACAGAPGGGMLIWEAGEAGEGRRLEEPATDRYWIMDVEGQRVVVTALSTGRGGEAIERVIGVAETTTFVAPE